MKKSDTPQTKRNEIEADKKRAGLARVGYLARSLAKAAVVGPGFGLLEQSQRKGH